MWRETGNKEPPPVKNKHSIVKTHQKVKRHRMWEKLKLHSRDHQPAVHRRCLSLLCLLGQHSTADTADSLPESALWHHPRAAPRGMESLPVLENYSISPVRCWCSLLFCMCVVKLLAVLFSVRTVVTIISWKNVISHHSWGTCLLPLYCIVIPISVSVTATEYNTVSNKKL